MKILYKISAVSYLFLLIFLGCRDSRIERVPPPPKSTQPVQDTHTGPDHDLVHPQPDEHGIIKVGPLTMSLPSDWRSDHPASSMRKAQFALPKVSGDTQDGMVALFYFGPDAGGLEANLKRWYGQFEQPDGSSTEAKVVREDYEYNGMKMVFVQFTGTMKASMMPGAPQTSAQSGWMNVSLIVMSPQGPWFMKGTGPEQTMRKHLESFRNMVSTVKFAG